MVSTPLHNNRVVRVTIHTINKCGAVSVSASWITSRCFTSYVVSSDKIMINELGKVLTEALDVQTYSLFSRRMEKTTCTQLGNSKLRPHNIHVDGSKRNVT
jgi:hypothetical protein